MARIKYKDPVTGEIKYADLAIQLPFPNGTANGDIPVWDNDNQEWVIKPKWKLFFQPVEYIENTGTGNYIKTGYTPTVNTEVIADMLISGFAGSKEAVMGTTTSSNHRCCFGISKIIDETKWYFGIGDTNLTGGVSDNNRHTFKLSMPDKKGYVDGVDIGGTAAQVWSSGEFTVFSRTPDIDGSQNNYCMLGKIYRLTMNENGTTIHDYIPCYNLFDSTIGLFDLVDNSFHVGTGTFTKGADV